MMFKKPELTCFATEAASNAAQKSQQPGLARGMLGSRSSQNPTPGHTLGRGRMSSQPLTPCSIIPSSNFSEFPSTQTRHQVHSHHRPYAQSPLQSFLEEEEEEEDLGTLLGQRQSQRPWAKEGRLTLKRAFGTSLDELANSEDLRKWDIQPPWQFRNAVPARQQSKHPLRSDFAIPQRPNIRGKSGDTRLFSRAKPLTSMAIPTNSKHAFRAEGFSMTGKESSTSSDEANSPSASQLETGLWSPRPTKKGPAKRLLLNDIPSSKHSPKQNSFFTPAAQSVLSDHRADRSWPQPDLEAHSPTVSLGGSDLLQVRPAPAVQHSVSRGASSSASGSVNREASGKLSMQCQPATEAEEMKVSKSEVETGNASHAPSHDESPQQFKSVFDFL